MTTTSTPADLTTLTPAEVDTLLAPIATAKATAKSRAYGYRTSARKAYSEGSRAHYLAEADRLDAEAAALAEQLVPFTAEWDRRGGWTRIYWCQSNGGHAHRSLNCSTLHFTTPMAWLPELSGKTEAELVDLAGESACTVCYPSAPVAALAKPSQLAPAREAREAKAARDADLAAKRAAKAAKAITAVDGSPLAVRMHGHSQWTETVATVATAWKLAVEGEADHLLYGYSYGDVERAARATLVEALAVKLGRTVEDVEAEVARKVAAKVKRGR